MSEGAIIFTISLGFLVFFPLMWVSISFLISHLSGWQGLAKQYAIDPPKAAPKPVMRWQSFSMGYTAFFPANYNRVVNIGVDSTYLYLSTMWAFRIGHKPLRIPFKDMEIADTNILFFTVKRLIAAQCPKVKIYMQPKLVAKIESYAIR